MYYRNVFFSSTENECVLGKSVRITNHICTLSSEFVVHVLPYRCPNCSEHAVHPRFPITDTSAGRRFWAIEVVVISQKPFCSPESYLSLLTNSTKGPLHHSWQEIATALVVFLADIFNVLLFSLQIRMEFRLWQALNNTRFSFF